MSPQQRLIDALLIERAGYPLASFVADRRERGLSWDDINKQLRDVTEGVADVTTPTLFRWYAKTEAAA
jgi:hypothetical protein